MYSSIRYRGADGADETILMPADEASARSAAMQIGELLGSLDVYLENPEKLKAQYPWAKGFVMGLPLPAFQRDACWTQEQKVRFIESIWSGVDLGSYMVNGLFEYVGGVGSGSAMREFSDALLDGQQRLSAIEAYVMGEFPVKDALGVARYWHELPRVERRRFSGTTFGRAEVRTFDEAKLRRIYNLRAFGGTAHKESERA